MRRSAAPRTPKSRRISITSRCCSRTKATPRPQSRYTSARWRSARRRWDSTIPTPRAASTTLLPYCRTKATSRTRGRTTSAPSRSTRRASVLSTPKQIAPAPILRICPSPKAQSVKRFRWRKQLLPRSKRRSAPIIPRRKAPPAWLQRRSPPSAARAMRRPYGSGMGLELGRHSRAVRFRLNSLTLSAISPKQRYPPISGQSAANVTSSCQRRRLEAPRRSASLTSWDYVDALARLRGFAGGKAGFTIFLVRKYLIWNVWATGNIVKKACSEDLPDSQGIVFVIESTSLCSFGEPEERQGAPLLEHRREQASRLRPSGAAACFVFGRDQFIPGGGLAQGGRGVRRRCGRLSDAGLVRRRPLRSGRGRRLGGAASPGRTAPASSAPMGRLDIAATSGRTARNW